MNALAHNNDRGSYLTDGDLAKLANARTLGAAEISATERRIAAESTRYNSTARRLRAYEVRATLLLDASTRAGFSASVRRGFAARAERILDSAERLAKA